MRYSAFRSVLFYLIFAISLSNNAFAADFETNPLESRDTQHIGDFESGINTAKENKLRIENLESLGKLIFNDTSLSASGKQACASCHDPKNAFSSSNTLSVQLGGKDMRQYGTRAVPSLRYLQTAPVFNEHYFEDEGPLSGQDIGPTGGKTWDGRVNTLFEQAKIPLFAENEMASSPQHILKAISKAKYAQKFQEIFGHNVLDNAQDVVQAVLISLETYQQNSKEFYPYSSKFDDVIRGKAQLTKQELNGYKLFNDPGKGNCASCHESTISPSGGFPQFTDYGYAALGIPRNMNIPKNNDKAYFDLGLCGPVRNDLKDKNEYCGMFKVPSLRNVARRKTFFHNGLVKTLEDAVGFYAERDTIPQKWYSKDKKGNVTKFNDIPIDYQQYIENKAPFGNQNDNIQVLTKQEIKDIIAFLKTLNDSN